MRTSALLICALMSLISPSTSAAHGFRDPGGLVYTLSNQPDDNRVLTYARNADGALVPAGSFSTGGRGTGGGLGNQGAVILSESGRFLFAVNPGSHDVSMFAVQRHGLRLVERVSSGGRRPVSLTQHGGLLYVLNAGGQAGATDNIAGFRIHPLGSLSRIARSVRPLSAASTSPAQISFSSGGKFLVVTEKDTNLILSFPVSHLGAAGEPIVSNSSGATPFGFAFGRRGTLFVSEAFGGAPDASALTSYELDRSGALEVASASVRTTETAACWVVLSPSGRYAYVTNTGSGTVSGYRVDEDGELELLDADGITATTGDGSSPIDAAASSRGRFVYVLASASHSIHGFRIERDGSLTPVGVTVGLPAGANGLIAD